MPCFDRYICDYWMWKNRHTHTHTREITKIEKKINLIQLSNENVKMKSKATKKKEEKFWTVPKKKHSER